MHFSVGALLAVFFVVACAELDSAKWRKVAVRDESRGRFKHLAVYASDNAGFYTYKTERVQLLSLVFVDPGRSNWVPDVPHSARTSTFEETEPGTNDKFGRLDQGYWQYGRIVATDSSFPCKRNGNIQESMFVDHQEHRGGCIVSSSVYSANVGPDKNGSAFQMSILLEQGKQYKIKVLEGMTNCTVPLEMLDRDWLDRNTQHCGMNITSKCPELCAFRPTNPDPQTWLSFDYSVPKYSANDSTGQLIALELPQYCSFEEMTGVWRGRQWSAPYSCLNKADKDAIISKSVGSNNNHGRVLSALSAAASHKNIPKTPQAKPHHRTPHTPQRTSQHKQPTHQVSNPGQSSHLHHHAKIVSGGGRGLCVMGDSHMVRLSGRNVLQNIGSRQLGLAPRYIYQFVFNTSVHDMLKGEHWHPQTSSMAKALDQCRQHADANGVIVWWIGSHALDFSAQNLWSVLNEGVELVFSPYLLPNRTLSDRAPLVVVVGVLDQMYEMVPAKFGSFMPYFQNSWRIYAQNKALIKQVHALQRKFKTNKVQFFDVYPQSSALHFDGHYEFDPVHMSFDFYESFGQTLIQAIKLLRSQI